MTTHNVMLKDNTVGTINADSIDYQDIRDFVGETVNVHLHDENGNPIEVQGELVEVL